MKKLNQKLVNFEIFINQVGAIYKLLCHIINVDFYNLIKSLIKLLVYI